MVVLLIGLSLFIGIHLVRELGYRPGLIEKFGTPGYKGIFSLVSVTGLGLIVYGKSMAPFITLWVPPYELRNLTHLLMLPAWILVMAGNLPLSTIKATLKHPMLLGVALWGGAHLLVNGDLASILLFALLATFSIVKIITAEKPEPSRLKESQLKKASLKWDAVAVVSGFILDALVMIYHGQLFGVGLSLE